MSIISWESICEQLKNKLPVDAYQKWVDNFELLSIEGSNIFIGYSDKKMCSEMTSMYMNDIFNAICTVYGGIATVKFKQSQKEVQPTQAPSYAQPEVSIAPKFDPMTGRPLEQVAPKFDPMTGRPLEQVAPRFDPMTGRPLEQSTPYFDPRATQPSYNYNQYPFEDYKAPVVDNTPKKEPKKAKEKKKKSKGARVGSIIGAILCVILAICIIVVGANFVTNMNFKETFYTISSPNVYDNIRIVQISDLHSVQYGANNSKLVDRVSALSPDLIVLTGDCVDSSSSANVVVNLCEKLVEIAPTYYVYGNNEEDIAFGNDMTLEALDGQFGFDDENRDPAKLYEADNGLRAQLEETGVKVLFNESDIVTVGESNKTTVEVFGVLTANSSAFWQYAGESFQSYLDDDDSNFKLFLTHEPYVFENLDEDTWGDLALCGHNHGGVVRLPKIGALYARGEGILPERNGAFVIGKYKSGDTPVIVSTGLTNSGMIRIHNQPELVIVDVSKY